MQYQFGTVEGFMHKPEYKSPIAALRNATGTMLYIYDADEMILAKNMQSHIIGFIKEHATKDDYDKPYLISKGIRNLDTCGIRDLSVIALSVEKSTIMKFYEWIIWYVENLIREHKGLPKAKEPIWMT